MLKYEEFLLMAEEDGYKAEDADEPAELYQLYQELYETNARTK